MQDFRWLLRVLLAVLPLSAADHVHAQNSVATDKAALVALYNATDGANWTVNTKWTSEETLSSWHGVTTDSDGRVTALALNDNGLDGTLPASLGNLSELEQLDLRDNDLSGALPSELGNLTNLTSLLLNESRALTGPLPDGLRELSDLETVNIEDTELCAPGDDTFQAWWETISKTGLICPPAEQSVIDVAVFYTPYVREAWGGTEEIETRIDLMVAETNQAYMAGGVNQRVRLVAVEEVEYTQSDVVTDLSRLTNKTDGYMDGIHAVRDQFAADAVLLVRSGLGANANLMATVSADFERIAFATTKANSLTFAHELGHLMGLHHDRYEVCENGRCTRMAFPYAYGYVNLRAFGQGTAASTRWRSVMAYDTRCDDAGFSCEWLLRFSNPDQIYPDPGGDPLGQSGLEPSGDADGPSDGVRVLNRTRGYVANFRRAPDITVSFAADQHTATEGGTAATVTLRLSGKPTRPIYVPLVAMGANGGTVYDYKLPARVTFTAEETEKSFTVAAVDDEADDDGEAVTLAFGEPLPAGVSEGSTAAATVTLADNDTVTDPPSILSVELTSTPGPKGAYAASDEIEATVRFDKTVLVTGTPQLTLTVGTNSRKASHSSTAGDVLRFHYTVADDDTDTDGVSIAANGLGENGGTIRDGADQDAGLTHGAVPADSAHRVDGVKPAFESATVDADVLTLVFSEALDETSVPAGGGLAGAIQVTVGGELRAVVGVKVAGEDVRVRLDPQVVHGDVVTVSYTPGSLPIRDLVGNAAASLSGRMVTNVTAEPVYDADADGLIGITTLAQLDAIRHDMDGDGVPASSGETAYQAAFPDAFAEPDARLRCGGSGCSGYELLADLDFDTDDSGGPSSGDTYWNGGDGWVPMGAFSNSFRATLEGNGHTIRNLFIKRAATNWIGLFAAVGGATTSAPAGVVRGVGLTAVDVTGNDWTGGLAGHSGGSVTTSHVTGRVSGDAFVGGLVGTSGGEIQASYSNAEVSGEDYVGGLLGFNDGTVTVSYATGSVSVTSGHGGGLVGRSSGGKIVASYSTAPAHSPTAGLVGSKGTDAVITSSYWDGDTSSRTTGLGSTRTTASLQAPTGYTEIYGTWNVDLDGDTVNDDPWDFGTSSQYPALKANLDGQGQATWQEFGYQLRESPALTATAGGGKVVLEWTAVDVTHWTPAPNVTYILTRDDGATSEILGEGLSGLTFTDTDVTADTTYTYQVAAVVTGGEATRSALVAATALPNLWLSPTASDPVAAVESRATYSVTFQGAWNTTVTADGVPSGAHFTTLIGGVHNAGVTFLSEGGMASAGVELMAELGGTSTLADEVRAAEPNALGVLQGSGGNIGPTSSSTISTVTVTTDHPRVTLLTMVAPSPDWFVGVSGLSLLDAQAGWLASLTANLYPWDAGTEEGAEFSLSNSATSPQGTITSLRGMGKFSDEPIATLTFTRQSVNNAPTFTSDTSFDVDENQTSAVATVLAEDPNSGDAVTYEITGGADSSQFQIVEATGALTFNTPPNYERPADVTSTDPANEAANNEYILTVTATGGTGDRALTAEQMITVTVRNLEEAGTVSFSKSGTAIRARLNDPDGGVSSASWQWARSSDRTTGWVDITGATSARYTPASDDKEMYLRATMSYNDGQGSGKQAQGVSTNEIAPPDLEITTLVSGLSIPWGITFAPDGTMLFTQRAGVLSSRLTDGTVQTVTAELEDLFASGETGLMGIVVDPGFSSNRRFYTCQGHTGPEVQVIAWTINAAYTEATRVADPLVEGIPAATGRHGGCRLRFGPQGYLWIATGDAATGAVPQDLTSLGGKVLRVSASTGEAAPGNPLGSRVYTYGHRNLQGLALRPDTNQMWSVEHGPSIDDEINLLVIGRNYGWDPVPGYNEGVSMTDFVKFPDALEAKWSSGSPTLATSGGIFLEGEQWGVWEGRLAVATLKDSKLRLFEFTPSGEFVSQVIVPQLDGDYGRLRTPMMGPDRALYVATSNGTDQILRIAKDATPPAVSSLAVDSDPGADRIYAPEDAIQVTVTFSETVEVEGTPRLVLRVGERNRPAGYVEGTGTTVLVFGYEVVKGDEDTDGVSIDANSLSLNGGTIKDRSKNSAELGHDGLGADSGHKVDGAGPDLAETDPAVVNTATLTLTFDEPLDGSSTPQASAFRVTGGDATRTVADVALSGSAVLLTLDPAMEHGETGIRVSYTVPTGMGTSPLQDVLGNEADRLSNVPVTNETPDTTPPAVSSLAISSDPGSDRTYAAGDEIQVTMTFSETVEVRGTPQLSLELGGGSRAAAYEGGTGTAALVFAYEVADGESDTDGVGVEADSLTGGTIRDAADNDAVPDHDALAADADHKVDGIKPRLAASGRAAANGTSLTLTYNEPLDGSSTPDAGDFTVSGGDQTRTVTRVSVSGSTVVLTLDVGAEHLEAGIRVSYTPGANPIRDVAGNQAEGLSQEPVANDTPDTTPPEVSSLTISSNPGSDHTYAAEDVIEVTVTFSETVKVTGTPRLRLRVGTRNWPAGYLRGTDTTELVFGYEVADGDEDTDGVSVEASRLTLNGGTVKDEADNAAELAHEALAAQADHKVDGVKPAFVSAAVDGSSLTLTYGEALDGGSRPTPEDFTAEVDGAGRSVSGVAISGSLVTLTLDPAVEHGDTGIRVSYTPGTTPIQDEVGNDAQGLSNRGVTNTTDEPNTAPEITTRGPLSVGENQALARRLQARDSDAGDEVTGWAIVGGTDRGRFAITSDTGELSFREAPDYESPADVASGDPVSGLEDNEYVVTVEVKSGAGARELTAEQTFLVRVTDEREPPEVPEAPDISGETADSLTVNWSEPDNTGPTITDYDVQYREKGTGGFTDGGHDGPGLSLTLSGLKEGTDYEVRVRAGNEEGTSGWSDSGEGMTVTPLTLVMASGTDPPVSGPFTVRFSFSEVVSAFSRGDIETEQVAEQDPACRDSQGNAVPCDPVIGALQTVDDRVFRATVTPGTNGVENNYTLRLRVPADTVSSSGSGQLNEEGMLEVRVAPPGVTLEMSSIGLRASDGNGAVQLRWNSPADNAGSAIIRYEYRYAAVGEEFGAWENMAAGTRGVTVEGLINGQEYVFELQAVNALGKGGAETVMATPVAGGSGGGFGGGGGGGGLLFPPEAPASLTAMPGDEAVRLEWSPPESDGGSPILRYEYRLKEGRGEFGEWTPILDSAPDKVHATGYTVGDLLNGTVYVFELRAVNAAGNGQESEAVEVAMPLDPAYWSNFRAEDLEGTQLMLEAFLQEGSSRDRELRFGEGLWFEQDELDGEGEVTATHSGSYGYRYTSRTTGELSLDFDGGEACQLRLTFSGEGAGSYSYRCGGSSRGQGSFRMSELVNRVPEITSPGLFEVEENTTTVGQLAAVDWDEGDEVTGYGIVGGADGGLFSIVAETGELNFKEAPDYENPGDVASEDPHSEAADNEYVLVVEVTSGEGERKRTTEQAIRVRVTDAEMEDAGEGQTGSEDPSDFTAGDLEGERLTLRLGGEGTTRSLELRFGEGNRFEQIESVSPQAATRAEAAASRSESTTSRSGTYTYEKTGPGMGTITLNYDDGASCEIRLSFTESGVGAFAYSCSGEDPAEGSFRLTTGSLFVPVILSSAGRNNSFFTSELTLTNRGERDVELDYRYTAHRGGGSGTASDVLPAGRQRVETKALTYLIGLGVPIPETGNRIGTLRVEVPLGSEVEAVVRTTTKVPDGRAGLAYLGVAEVTGFDEAVYLCGLRQNDQDRSNLAFQNMGAPEEGAITLRATVYSGEAGDTTARVRDEITLDPGGFHQYSPVLGVLESADGNRQGYVKVERVEGTAPFYAYGVINDQANSDGSFVFPVTASSLQGTMGQTLPVIVETSEFTSELMVTNFSEEERTLDFEFVAEGIEADDKTASFSMTLKGGQQEIIPELVEALRRQGVAGLGTTRGFYLGPVFVMAEEGDLSGIVIGARTGSEGGGGSYSVLYNAVPEGAAYSQETWVDGLQQNQENRSNLALVNTGEVDESASVFHLEIYDGETGTLVETVVTKAIPARRWHQINGILLRAGPETRQGYMRIEKVSGENPFLAYGVVNDGGAPGERSGDGAYLPARE